MQARQLALGLVLRDDATFGNFYPGDNVLVFSHLQKFAALGGEPFVYLWGAPGAGRTHLLQACCHAVEPGQGIYLDLAEPALQPAVLEDMEYFSLICLDNVDAVIGRQDWEMALFNFYNRSREREAHLLIAGKAPPAQLPCGLADLCSRLSWGLVLNLLPLTDDQKLSALQMRARHRGLKLSAEVGGFLMRHYSRDTNDLFLALETLDCEALSAKRRLTIPFVKQVLDWPRSTLLLSKLPMIK